MTALTSELHGLDTARMLHTNLGRTKPLLILSRLLLVTVSISVVPFSLSSTSALAAQAETIQQLTAKAEEMMKQKKFGEAKKQLKKALKLDKNSFDANAFMAVIFREEKHRKEALNTPTRPFALTHNAPICTIFSPSCFTRQPKAARQKPNWKKP